MSEEEYVIEHYVSAADNIHALVSSWELIKGTSMKEVMEEIINKEMKLYLMGVDKAIQKLEKDKAKVRSIK